MATVEGDLPASVPSHSTVQTFYFDATDLLRRHDYSVDIMGGTARAKMSCTASLP
jgi:hypothetical protein